VIILDRFEFQRSKVKPHNGANPFLGTWSLAEEHGGQKALLIVTPTHWMCITKAGDSFSWAAGGTYSLSQGNAALTVLYKSPNHETPSLITIERSLLVFGKHTFKRVTSL
jgi:hypothetical protein